MSTRHSGGYRLWPVGVVLALLTVGCTGDPPADPESGSSSAPGPPASSPAPTSSPAAPLSDETRLTAVSATDWHLCVLGATGLAWCLGDERDGALGTDDPAWGLPQAVAGGHEFATASAGANWSCALDRDGAAWCWGQHTDDATTARYESTPEPSAVPGGHTFTAIATGDWSHACALDASGAAWCWGSDKYGQLGDSGGTSVGSNTPVALPGGHVFTMITAGGGHTCGLDAGGQAWCWGLGGGGQLGSGSEPGAIPEAPDYSRPSAAPGDPPITAPVGADSPVAVAGGHRFVAIDAGNGHTCALDSEGSAWCWGSADGGALGSSEAGRENQQTPVRVQDGHVFTSVSSGYSATCGLDSQGSAWCWGNHSRELAPDPLGESEEDPFFPTPTEVPGGHRFASVDVRLGHSCAVDDAGGAWCWGQNEYGQLGAGRGEHGRAPVAVSSDRPMAAIVVGSEHSCALDQTGTAWCWGRDLEGQRGDGPGPSAGSLRLVAGGHDLTAIGADSLSCALDRAGAAWCWGTAAGRGDEPAEVLPVPTPVPGGHRFTALSVDSVACALDTDGAAWCWGAGLPATGDADASSTLTPVEVRGGHTFTALSAGYQHACALDAKGRAWCWGNNTELQLGNPDDSADPLTPVAVHGAHSFSAIAAGGSHSCALDTDGRAWCWGDNSEGALARDPWSDSALESSASPLPIPVDPPLSVISAAQGHTCALDGGGRAWCWGDNSFGALDGTSWEERTDAVSPRAVPGAERYTAISAGPGQTCAIDTNGIAWCWGELLDSYGVWSELRPFGPTALDPATLPLR